MGDLIRSIGILAVDTYVAESTKSAYVGAAASLVAMVVDYLTSPCEPDVVAPTVPYYCKCCGVRVR